MKKMRKLKLNCNTLNVTYECSRISGEVLWTNSSWFLWIRVEVLYEALVVKHKWGTHKQHKHVYDMAIWIDAQSNRERERELKESGSIANTQICFEVRAHSSTSPPSHRRISTNLSTQDSHTGNLHWGFGTNTIGSIQLLSQLIQPLTEAMHNKHKNHLT